MRIYLFEDVTCTDNWHSGGSVMVLAETDQHVLDQLENFPAVQLTAEDWQRVRHFTTHNYELPEVFIFPDAGCC